jgi:hypothetical protein
LAGARAVRAKLGVAEPALPQPVPAAEPEAAPVFVEAVERAPSPPPDPIPTFIVALEDDPYQCAFCGKQTEPEADRCPHCRRGLLSAGLWHGGKQLYTLLILVGIQTQAAVLEAVAVYGFENFSSFTEIIPGSEIWSINLLWPALMRGALWVLLVLMLLSAGLSGFRMAWLVATADLAWMAVGYALGHVGPQLAAANGALSGLIWLVAAAAVLGEWQARQRVRVVLDKNLHTAIEYHRRAQAYAQRGLWALAAVHWRKAVAVDPYSPAYYKALGRAQTRLGRAAEAHAAWASGAELDPGDREFHKLMAK